MDNFFYNEKKKQVSLKRFLGYKKTIKLRKKRSIIAPNTFFNSVKFSTGDILSIIYWIKGVMFFFEGICISLKCKSFKTADVILILRNIIDGVGIELTISYFYNRLFKCRFLDFKRKRLNYKRSKLFFVRDKLNRASRVKS